MILKGDCDVKMNENLKGKARKYCTEKNYIILKERKDGVVYLDRLMDKRVLPYFFFKNNDVA